MDNVGSIAYDARIETKNFNKDANEIESRASQVASNVEKSGGGFRNFASQASDSFNSVADGIGRVLKSAVLLGTTGAFGIGAATKASWDQVAAVEQATVGLRAYERDGNKVNAVLKDLIAYARSDLGVLFNRKDLFESAQMLKLNGVATEDLNKDVQILSRSVGLGLGNWQDLNAVVGRVIATGRLSGIEFDQLTQYGFKLDKSLRNTDISATDLFNTLDKGIPVDAMAGQANTIRGLGIRMETAFRGIGDAILGVDADTSKFIKGGLGDRLIGILSTVTVLLKNPELKDGFKKMGQGIADFASSALPALIKGFTWMVNNLDTIVAGVTALGVAFVAAKLAAIGFSIAASANPIGLIAAAIVALIAGLTYLQIKFDIFGKAMEFLKPITDQVTNGLKTLYDVFQTYLLPILEQVAGFVLGQLKEAWSDIKAGVNAALQALSPYISKTQLLQAILIASLVPIGLVVGAIVGFITIVTTVVVVVARLIGILSQAMGVFTDLQMTVYSAMAVFVNAVVGGVNKAVEYFVDINKKILNAFGNTNEVLFNAGKGLIDGLINGIKSAFGSVKKTLGDLTSKLPDWKGPITTDKKILNKSGQYVIGGFIDGLESMYGSVQSSLGGLTAGIGSPMVGASIGSLDSLNSGISSNNQVTVNLSLSGIMARSKSDERDIAKSLIKTVNEELSAKGVALIGGGNV